MGAARAWVFGILFAAAFLTTGSGAIQAAVVYQTGFESAEGYGLGPLDGQQGWSADADTAVQSSNSAAGDYAVTMVPQGDYTGQYQLMAMHYLTVDTTVDPLVTVSQQVNISDLDEAEWLVSLMSGLTESNRVLFSYTGDILVNGTDTGSDWSAGSWQALEIVMDHAAERTDVYYGGSQIAGDVPFVASVDGLNTLMLSTDDYVAQGSNMFYDSLVVTAVPEPGTLALALVGLAAVLRRRRNH